MTPRALVLLLLVAACGEPVAAPLIKSHQAGPLRDDATTSPQTFYGPERFTRTTGAPNQFTRSISTLGFVAPFVLHVRNGATDGSSRISSGSVSVDGVGLLGPSDLNQTQGQWDIPVSLGNSATLIVQLASKPGSFLDISVSGVNSSSFNAITTGLFHSCALTPAGAAYCWGRNNFGQLGDGTTTDHPTPKLVQGGPVFATGITSGGFHTCALTKTGAAYCWGDNGNGQLGDGTTTDRGAPVAVQGGMLFTALTEGDAHTCGLTSAGAAYCWGINSYGTLGDGTTTDRSTPTAVQGGLVFTTLTGGGAHTCGLTSSGAAYCWGGGGCCNGTNGGVFDFGQLGDGTTTPRLTPVPVLGGLAFTDMAAGGFQTCALTSAGAAYCWGSNNDGGYGDNAGLPDQGQLGDGTTIDRLTPVAVQGGHLFSALRMGADFSCGVTGAGAMYCWGDNSVGELADGTTINRLSPVPAQGGLVFTIPLPRGRGYGGYHGCGLTNGGGVYCWGYNYYGQLGDGTTTNRLSPVAVIHP